MSFAAISFKVIGRGNDVDDKDDGVGVDGIDDDSDDEDEDDGDDNVECVGDTLVGLGGRVSDDSVLSCILSFPCRNILSSCSTKFPISSARY